jgi:hypothetical protein
MASCWYSGKLRVGVMLFFRALTGIITEAGQYGGKLPFVIACHTDLLCPGMFHTMERTSTRLL